MARDIEEQSAARELEVMNAAMEQAEGESLEVHPSALLSSHRRLLSNV